MCVSVGTRGVTERWDEECEGDGKVGPNTRSVVRGCDRLRWSGMRISALIDSY